MKWFKHDSDANCDAKLRKLRLKYGMEGYGLYWLCLELIARNVDKGRLNFELEHDAEIISSDTGIHQERASEMMEYMVSLRLFENTSGIITCLKMRDRTDEYTQKLLRSSENLGTLSGQTPDNLGTKSALIDKKRTEEKRTEEKRTEEIKKETLPPTASDAPTKKRFSVPSLEEVAAYCTERGGVVSPGKWFDHYTSNGWKVGKNPMRDWKAAVRTWESSQRSTDTPKRFLTAQEQREENNRRSTAEAMSGKFNVPGFGDDNRRVIDHE